MAEHILIFLWLIGIFVNDALSCFWVKPAWCVPRGDILLGRGIAVSLLSVQVQQLRPFHVLHLTKDSHQFLYVMSVVGTKVTDVHAFKDVLLMGNSALEGIGQSL